MKISYKQFFDRPEVPDSSIYLILGKPYHLQNDVQHRLESYFKRGGSSIKNLVIDSDFDINYITGDSTGVESIISGLKYQDDPDDPYLDNDDIQIHTKTTDFLYKIPILVTKHFQMDHVRGITGGSAWQRA